MKIIKINEVYTSGKIKAKLNSKRITGKQNITAKDPSDIIIKYPYIFQERIILIYSITYILIFLLKNNIKEIIPKKRK